jgi:hypothetical protein
VRTSRGLGLLAAAWALRKTEKAKRKYERAGRVKKYAPRASGRGAGAVLDDSAPSLRPEAPAGRT